MEDENGRLIQCEKGLSYALSSCWFKPGLHRKDYIGYIFLGRYWQA